MYSVNNVIAFIKKIEIELELYDIKIADEYIWPLLRFKLADKIERALDLIQVAHDQRKSETRLERYQKALIYDGIIKFYHKKHEQIIIPHPRRSEVNGRMQDIYTYDIQAKYPSALVLERSPYNNLHQKNTGLVLLEECVLDKYNKTIQKRIGLYEPIYMLQILEKAILEAFQVEIDINAMLKEEWKHFVIREERFISFLKKVQAKEVILVVGYVNYDLIRAAKKCNVRVIEIQHGIIDSNHLGYNFDYPLSKECFADELWLFANYWAMNTNLPLDKEQIKLIGFKYFHDQASLYAVERKDNQIIFLSQGTSGQYMVKEALRLARAFPQLQIIYKLHPGEFQNYATRYPDLLKGPNNVRIICNELPLYELLKSSKYLVGAYSTAIYEGLALGCIGILLDVVGTREYMDVLIKQNLVYITKDLVREFSYIATDAYDKKVINIYF